MINDLLLILLLFYVKDVPFNLRFKLITILIKYDAFEIIHPNNIGVNIRPWT